MKRKELLKERGKTTSKEKKILLMLSYNGFPSNKSKIARKYWSILSISKSFKKILHNLTQYSTRSIALVHMSFT